MIDQENPDTATPEPGQARLEEGPCPKCGCRSSVVLFEGQDYLYHLPGTFFVSECQHCGLWFQNPRPVIEDITKTYPSSYGPHARPNRVRTGSPSDPVTADQEGGREVRSRIWSLLKNVVPPGLKRPLRAIRHPIKAYRYLLDDCYALYLQDYLGYGHLSHAERRRGARFLMPILYPYCKWLAGVRLIPRYIPAGRLIELGCGNGSFMTYLRHLGWQDVHGIEVVSAAAQTARDSGLSVDCGRIEDVMRQYPDHYFDVIISSMVLEHLYNPFQVVQIVAKKLKPGGQFIFSTVVRDGLDSRIFRDYWSGFDFPRHMVYFQKSDLYGMLKRQFEKIEVFHQNAPIDFVRPAVSRKDEGKGTITDDLILKVARSPLATSIGLLLAWFGLTCRVSLRCQRKHE